MTNKTFSGFSCHLSSTTPHLHHHQDIIREVGNQQKLLSIIHLFIPYSKRETLTSALLQEACVLSLPVVVVVVGGGVVGRVRGGRVVGGANGGRSCTGQRNSS